MEVRNYCPICIGASLKPAIVRVAAGGYGVDCPACGSFAISEECWEDILDPQSAQGHKLTTVQRARLSFRIRKASKDGNIRRPNVNSDFVERFIADGCPGPTPAEQASNLISFVGDKQSESGEKVDCLPDEIYTIIGSPNPGFACELALELIESHILVGQDTSGMGDIPTIADVGLTLSGWQTFAAERAGKFSGKSGFIAMKFGDTELDPLVAEIIKPAIKRRIGYDLFDMRDVARAGIIDNIMRAQIRDAAFVIVDLTHDNAGAYWEAGYAEGLGKPVIYICERTKFDEAKTHFDTNHCTTVIWSRDSTENFSNELIATLRRSLNLFADAGN